MADDKPTEYVTLVSNDGFEFKILRSAACIAGTIKKALDPLCVCTPSSHHTTSQANKVSQLASEKTPRTASTYLRLSASPPTLSFLDSHSPNKRDIHAVGMVQESQANRVISGVVLEKVCEYLYYNQKHAESKDVSDMDIPPELCLELLIAADYLDGT